MAITLTPITEGQPRGKIKLTPAVLGGDSSLLTPKPSIFSGPEQKTTLFIGANSQISDTLGIQEAIARNSGDGMSNMASTFKDTGWFLGLDNKWRKEIDDSKASIDMEAGSTLGEVLDHPQLFEAYPQLRDITVETIDDPKSRYSGWFRPKSNTLGLNTNQTPEKMVETVIHELQHTIQEEEGFHRGGTSVSKETSAIFDELSKDADKVEEWANFSQGVGERPSGPNLLSKTKGISDIYQAYGGEAESRQVERRIKLTPVERTEQHPSFSRDIRDVDILKTESMRDRDE